MSFTVRALGHIGEIVKHHGQKNTIGDIKLLRSKYTAIIEYFIVESFKELKRDLQDKKNMY